MSKWFTIILFPAWVFASTETSTFDLGALKYNSYKPQWALGLNVSPYQLSEDALTLPSGKQVWLTHYALSFEFQPGDSLNYSQNYGVFGFGPQIALHVPTEKVSRLQSDVIYDYSVGGVVRYQALFFSHQFIVPSIAYTAELWRFKLRNNMTGNMWVKGPTLGVWVLLNFFDSENGKDFFYDYGIARTYVVFEMKQMKGSLGEVATSGRSYFGGLRFEF